MSSKEIMELYDEHVINAYNQISIILDKGHGAVLYDIDGNKYIYFFQVLQQIILVNPMIKLLKLLKIKLVK